MDARRSATGGSQSGERLFRAAGAIDWAARLLVLLGAVAAAYGWDPAVLAAVGLVVVAFLLYLTAGIVAYRDVMSRPWPQVEPIVDDDDW